jgi:hypothetical protein
MRYILLYKTQCPVGDEVIIPEPNTFNILDATADTKGNDSITRKE